MIDFNPDEIRAAFNRQHAGHGGPEWLRIDLSTGPVLARRNVGHHSSPIYVAVIDKDMARHWMVTMKRQLKSNGSSAITAELRNAWSTLIGFTESEYRTAMNSASQNNDAISLYERGPARR